jgi:hypothetical protein
MEFLFSYNKNKYHFPPFCLYQATLQHAEVLFACCLRIQTESSCTEIFGYWKQVINSESSVRKPEMVKFTFNKITEL